MDPAGSSPGASPSAVGRHLGGLAVLALLVAGWLALFFAAAGTLRWPTGWVYVGFTCAALLAHRSYVARRNPELVRRRRAIGPGTPRWDLVWGSILWPLMIAVPVVGALDVVRLRGTGMPLWLWPAGAALTGYGLALSAWAMGVNPHFEGTVRIQRDRDHRVIEAGPYRHLRHPGYLGLLLWPLGTPFMLGSCWALVPAWIAAAWVVLRAALEDRFLQRELAGYADYAERVRYRLVPGIW